MFENEHCVAFRDINPQAPVHVLVVPREHVASLNQTYDPTLVGRLLLAAAEIAKQEGVAEAGLSRRLSTRTARRGRRCFTFASSHVLGGRLAMELADSGDDAKSCVDRVSDAFA